MNMCTFLYFAGVRISSPSLAAARKQQHRREREPYHFGGRPLGLREQRLADVENALPDADARALEHDEVLLHHTVVRETAHRVDRLLRDVLLRRSVTGDELGRRR